MSAFNDLQKRYDDELAARDKLEAKLFHESQCRQKLEETVQILNQQLEEARSFSETEMLSYLPDLLYAKWIERRTSGGSVYSAFSTSNQPAPLNPRNRRAGVVLQSSPARKVGEVGQDHQLGKQAVLAYDSNVV